MDKPKQGSKRFAHTRETPPRVAARLEGVVKNRGIKPKKKHKKARNERKKS